MPTAFTGSLNTNALFASIYNMIISQQIMAPDLADNYSALVSKFRVDGSMYGDQKLFYDVDVLASRPWLGDAEATNLLNVNRPDDPECQTITLNAFRQIDITVDNYLTKQAWNSEGIFSQFNSIILSLLGKTKKIYETTMVNTYIGTAQGNATRSDVEIDLTTALTGLSGEEKARVEAQTIAQSIADLIVDMKDYSRDFNDYGFMRAYSENQLMFIWNSKYINKITKLDLPTIFHKEGLVDKFEQYVLPARYFGEIVDSVATDTTDFEETSVGSDKYAVKSGVVVRAMEEVDLSNGTLTKHYFPGDQIASGYIVKAPAVISGGVVVTPAFDLSGSLYVEDGDVICKVVTPDTFKYMSAFQVGTNFFNARSLTENHYLTWGFAYPDRLLGQPCVTVHVD